MSETGRVFINEWMKLIRRKRLWIAAILALMIVALFAYGTYRDAQSQSQNNSPAAVEQQIQSLQNQIAKVKAQPKTVQEKANLKDMQSQLSQEEQQYQEMHKETAGNWKPAVKQQIRQTKREIKSLGAGADDRAQAGELKVQLLTLNYELNRNVAPLLPWLTSPYTSMTTFLEDVSAVFLPLLVVIVAADMVSAETTSGTIKLLLIRPVSRTRVLLGKWLASLAATALLSVATCLAMLLAGIAVAGNHGATQPQVVGLAYRMIHKSGTVLPGENSTVAMPLLQHAQVLPMWEYVLITILLVTLAMFVVATVAFLCSVLFKSSMASTSVAIGAIIVGNIALGFIHSKWLAFLFTSHLDPQADWIGAASQTFGFNVGLPLGLLVMGGWIVVAIGVSIVKFRRQDILNA